MDPELDLILEECDNIFEAFFAALVYYMVKIIFRVVEVVLGEDAQESNQGS